MQLTQGHIASQESRQEFLDCIPPGYKCARAHTHTHRATHLKGLCLPAPNLDQAKQKRIVNILQCQIKPKGAQCTATRVKEEEAAGRFWQQKTCFCKTNEIQGKPQTCTRGPGSHRRLLPCYEDAHASTFVDVLLFDHDFGTVITVSSSRFPGNRCSRGKG